ncbi:MAG: DUF4097 family beta strand repeat protein [candidate division Zixibacteria bacterium]|nr:DUF4097 family beta strand repeat protein [candidate division Zixibacteria bacterium]
MNRLVRIIVILLAITSVVIAGDTIEESFEISPGELLEMDLETGGSIAIVGWDKNEVSVKVYLSGRDWEDCEVEFDKKSSGLEIISRYDSYRRNKNARVEFEIQVPNKFDLDLETNGGTIELDNIEGNLQGKTLGGSLDFQNLTGDLYFRTNGGSIDCSNIKGEADLKTNGGSITCSDSEINGRAHTNGGSVRMRNVAGDFKCTTNGGRVIYDNDEDFKGKSSNDVIRIKTMGGSIDVVEAPLGADVHTNGGDIEIKSAGEFVKAHTNGGDIYIGQVDGWVDVDTYGGDITVAVTGDGTESGKDIEMRSNNGEIELTLPANFSGEFDIELAYTKRGRRQYKIISDFDLKTRESDDWDYDRGSPRKYIDGTGVVGDGKNKVRITTINGDIIIKKD